MRILYAGSPEIAAIPLEFLAGVFSKPGSRHEIAGVLTNPPSPQRRSSKPVPTPVAQTAAEILPSVPVFTPEKLTAEIREEIAAVHPDILVCFAYGKIFGPKFMALFPQGGINLHPSLLPKYRGCAPVPAVILSGDTGTGITVQRLAQDMDAGDILAQITIPLNGTETAESLLHDAAGKGGAMILEVLDRIADGTVQAVPQHNEDATYCTMLRKEDGRIDWTKPAAQIDAQIRAFYPWPLAFTAVNGTVLRIHAAAVYTPDTDSGGTPQTEEQPAVPGSIIGTDAKQGILIQTGSGILAVSVLQWQAKKAMAWKDFLNGSRNFISGRCDV